MPTLLEKILANTDVPLYSQYPRSISLLLDEDCNTLDFSAPTGEAEDYLFHFKDPVKFRKIFRLPEGRSLSQIMERGRNFPGFLRELRLEEEKIESFFTSLPVFTLRLLRVERGYFLGVVTYTDAQPKVLEKSTGSLVYLDEEERIVGMSSSFQEYFRKKFADPFQILGQQLEEFLTPTPRQWQAQRLSDVQIPGDDAWQLAGTEIISGEKSGLGDGHFLTFPGAFDLPSQDLKIELTLTVPGPPPCFVLGDHQLNGRAHPDINGYLLGPDASRQSVLLKKYGFFVDGRTHDFTQVRDLRYTFFKIDKALCLYDGRGCIFKYWDGDPPRRGETQAMLYLRPGERFEVKQARMWLRPSANPSESNPDIMVRLKEISGRYFLVSRFDSAFLTAHGLTGFRLQDMTEFQNRIHRLEGAYERERKEKEALSLRLATAERREELIGSSKAILEVKEKAERVAAAPTTVLIQGPTGAGKEVLSQFIHRASPFSEGPFIKVDCSTLPQSLMESELFGYEKGAFTGADKRRAGLFERAEGGTLFLDELNNLTPQVQMKLLQFLQDRTIVRVGGEKPLKLNLRVIAASNLDLKRLVREGAFREDLYYRIAVVTILLPPLRERREDLPVLCEYFLAQLNRTHRKNITRLTPEAFRKLYEYSWPGNIRELKNVLEQAAVFCDEKEIGAGHLVLPAPSVDESMALPEGPPTTRKERRHITLSKEAFLALLEENNGIMTRAARAMGVTPQALYYHLKKLGVAPNELRKNPYRRKA